MRHIIDRLFLLCVVVALSLPLSILKIGELDLPLSVVPLAIGLLLFLIIKWNIDEILLCASICLSFISLALTATLISESKSINPVLSLLYFFLPYFSFYLGRQLIRKRSDFHFFLLICSWVCWVTCVSVAIDIFRGAGVVRIGGELQGAIFGFTLYGTYGVNTLAVYYATMCAVMLTYAARGGYVSLPRLFLMAPGIVASFYLVLFSVSREAILGLLIFVVLFMAHVFSKNRSLGIGMFILMLAPIYFYLDEIILSWSTKILMMGEGDLDDMSSGRHGIFILAMSDIFQNPFMGSSFHGFGLFNSETVVQNTLGENTSVHNQYITTVWKMGGFAAFFFAAFLYRTLRTAYHSQKCGERDFVGLWILILVYLLIFMNLWDVLLTPLLGGFFMFLVGSFVGVSRAVPKVC